MLKMYDFCCDACANAFEALVNTSAEDTGTGGPECPRCHSTATARRAGGLHVFHTIVATSKTAKKYKAGYVHKFKNRPAEKISVQVPATPNK